MNDVIFAVVVMIATASVIGSLLIIADCIDRLRLAVTNR